MDQRNSQRMKLEAYRHDGDYAGFHMATRLLFVLACGLTHRRTVSRMCSARWPRMFAANGIAICYRRRS